MKMAVRGRLHQLLLSAERALTAAARDGRVRWLLLLPPAAAAEN